MMHNWNFWGMSMMWLIWLPLIGLFVWFVIQSVRNGSVTQEENDPLKILKTNFAEGKITKEEYKDRLEILSGN